jgi:hypothetical protein
VPVARHKGVEGARCRHLERNHRRKGGLEAALWGMIQVSAVDASFIPTDGPRSIFSVALCVCVVKEW